MSELLLQLLCALCILLIIFLLSFIAGSISIRLYKKRGLTFADGYIVEIEKLKNKNSYQITPISQAGCILENRDLADVEPESHGLLESAPDGYVSKLDLGIRGSWRLANGYLLSKEELLQRINEEYNRML